MFDIAIKENINIVDGIDMNSLPCFQAMRGAKKLPAPEHIPLMNSATSASSDHSHPLPLPATEPHQETEESDDDGGAGAAWKIPAFANAKAKASTKAAKAKAKVPKEKAAPKRENKRKNTDSEVVELGTAPKLQRSDGDEADRAIIAKFSEDMEKLQKSAFICENDAEPSIVECLKSGHKKVKALNDQVKAKHKSLSRRSNNADYVLSELEAITSDLNDVLKLCQDLLNCGGEDTNLVDSMKQLGDWTFSHSLKKRALKCACISNLKYADWKSFTGTTRQRMTDVLGSDDADSFFWLMVNECAQKLLRGLPTKKVTSQIYCIQIWIDLYCLFVTFMFGFVSSVFFS